MTGGTGGTDATGWTGAVLVGGASRRMGRDKATLPIDGVPMAARVAAALTRAGATDVWCVGSGMADIDRRRRTIADDHPGQGPLGGLLTALRHAADDLVVVLACDLLEPSSDAIADLVAAAPGHAATVPMVDGSKQWLHAAWSRSRCIEALTASFEQGERSVWRAAAGLDVHVVEASGPGFADADVPADLPAGTSPAAAPGS